MLFIPLLVIKIFMRDHFLQFENNEHDKKIKVKREKNGEILELYFEDYIVGVLSGEMPANFELEALKAQAVAARSYAYKKILNNKSNEYDVIDTVSNQVYLDDNELKTKWKDNYSNNLKKIKTAVSETNGEYITYNNEVIEAFFFSTSNGKTENVEEIFSSPRPYLKSVDSTWDQDVSPVFHDTEEFSLNDFYTKLNLPYQDKLNVEITEKTSTGRPKKVKINGKELDASIVRTNLNLRSTAFIITQIGTNVKIETTGFGHGVGMSQYGAQGMAKQGYSYKEIIKHYYQGVEIKKI